MKGFAPLFLGIIGTFFFSWAGLALIPNVQIGHFDPQSDEEGTDIYPWPKSGMADRGRRVYAANGCVYCHTQQVRADYAASDIDRKWGERRSAPRDYLFERPAFLGKMRMGPDLANVGKRAPAEDANAPQPTGSAAPAGAPPAPGAPAAPAAGSPPAPGGPAAPAAGSPAAPGAPAAPAAGSPPAPGAPAAPAAGSPPVPGAPAAPAAGSPPAPPSGAGAKSPPPQSAPPAAAAGGSASPASAAGAPAGSASPAQSSPPAASPAAVAAASPPGNPPQAGAAAPAPTNSAVTSATSADAITGPSGRPIPYSAAWHHAHLYSPRSINLDSTMPAYRFLYDKRRIQGEPAADALKLAGNDAPTQGWEVVPTYEARCLVAYLMSLDQSHSLNEVKSTTPPSPPAPAKKTQ